MTQKEEILTMLEFGRTGVTCKEFADRFLYHKLASRISELKQDGYDIRFIKGDNTMEGKYILIGKPIKAGKEIDGQLAFA